MNVAANFWMETSMKDAILYSAKEALRAIELLTRDPAIHFIENAARLISSCYQDSNKILIAGNGGSLCDAMHFAEELTGYYRKKRRALPAIALSDPGHITCVANDTAFDQIFARGVEALGCKGDVFIALTTSGNSKNLKEAILQAKKQGLKTLSFLGKTGGEIKGLADLEWIVDGFKHSDRIQEVHMAAIHMIIEMVEKEFFETVLSQNESASTHRSEKASL